MPFRAGRRNQLWGALSGDVGEPAILALVVAFAFLAELRLHPAVAAEWGERAGLRAHIGAVGGARGHIVLPLVALLRTVLHPVAAVPGHLAIGRARSVAAV